MLVPFVIDVDSLTPDPAWTSAQQRACHNNLLDVWQRIGLLMHDGTTFDGSRLKAVVLTLPQNLRPLWQEVLERVPLSALGIGWNGSVTSAFLPVIASRAKLAFVDDVRAEVEFGYDDDCDEKVHPIIDGTNIGVCRLLAANQAVAFRAAVTQSGIHIEAGDTFQAIWDSRFKTLAAAPLKRVFIVDRYAISQHYDCPQTRLSGLERFLRLLDGGASGQRHITIYSAWTTDLYGKTIEDVESDIRHILSRLTVKNIKRIKLLMVPNTGFRDDGHDRFVRFEEYVWDIGLGLEVFENAYAAKRSAASFKTGLAMAGYKQVEQDLAGHRDTRMKEIR
jgi:hypothetical protein